MATLDSLTTALKTTLTSVGTVQAVFNRDPDVAYRGATPALFIRPLHVARTFLAARAKEENGTLELYYIDTTPAQQAQTLAQVEDAMYANREAIITAIEANPSLSGAAVYVGAQIETLFNPDGPFVADGGALWVSFTLHVSFRSLKIPF